MLDQRAPVVVTPFTQQFGIDYPIIGAPMFLVSDVRLVVATSVAGGLGSFPALNYRPIEKYAEAVDEIKRQTNRPFAINIIAQDSNRWRDQHLAIALEKRVPLIISSLGSPKSMIDLAHQVGTKVYCDVINLKHAQKVADLGADGLIVVSHGAGGHAGDTSPFALIPYLVEKVKLPVVASGAIVDGRGMLAAFGLGASAVYMGTRFIASDESAADRAYKQAIVDANPEDIVNTDRVDGFPGNFIRTSSLEQLGVEDGLIESLLKRSKKARRWIALSRAARSLFGAATSKHSYKTIFSAGHGVGLVDRVEPVDAIIQQTVRDYLRLKAKLP